MIGERIKSEEDAIQRKDIDLLDTRTATWRVRPVTQGMSFDGFSSITWMGASWTLDSGRSSKGAISKTRKDHLIGFLWLNPYQVGETCITMVKGIWSSKWSFGVFESSLFYSLIKTRTSSVGIFCLGTRYNHHRIRGQIHYKWGRLVTPPILERIVRTAMVRGNVPASLRTSRQAFHGRKRRLRT